MNTLSKDNPLVIVGGDGAIGAAVRRSLAARGVPVVATSRRAGRPGAGWVSWDLARGGDAGQLPAATPAALLAAGVTGTADCRTDPAGSARVNVEGALEIAGLLRERGACLLLLSTSQVFDGAEPWPEESDPVRPITEYGRQKAEAEARLLRDFGPAASVLRLTKVVAGGLGLVNGWARSLARGEEVHPFSDMFLAPVSLELATEAICRLLLAPRPGIWHLSAGDEVSYADLAGRLTADMGAPARLVRPVRAADAQPPGWPLPLHSGLGMAASAAALGLEPPPARKALETALSKAEEEVSR